MNQTLFVGTSFCAVKNFINRQYAMCSFFAGILIPCGFSPIHLPILTFIGMAWLFIQLQQQTGKKAFYHGLLFGLGFFSLGVSWIYVSIHNYGHLDAPLSALITLLFIAYLALFPGFMAIAYQRLSNKQSVLVHCILFSALWCISEWARAHCMTGFPWLLLGFGQMNTPLKHLLPVFGIFGGSFSVCLIAACCSSAIISHHKKKYLLIIVCSIPLTAALFFKSQSWTTISEKNVSIGVIQANLSMKDKWDETIFWQLLQRYQNYIKQLLSTSDVILMPESAIPVPANYISEFVDSIHQQALKYKTAIIFGVPQISNGDDTAYYNTLTTLGLGEGTYFKQHLVPFGEFIPKPFQRITDWLQIPAANMVPGKKSLSLVRVHNHLIAILICYVLGYPNLLRQQLPEAEWIVSISDDGWFGHSLAMYQQLEMAQVLSLQTGRYQIMANNDGLSSMINPHGDIIASLPAFHSGILRVNIHPAYGATPWVRFGDLPILMFCAFIILFTLIRHVKLFDKKVTYLAPI